MPFIAMQALQSHPFVIYKAAIDTAHNAGREMLQDTVIMGRKEHGSILFIGQPAKQQQYVIRSFRIEVARGLIRYDDLRPVEQCPGNDHALLFPSRKLMRPLASRAAEPDLAEHFRHPLLHVLFFFPICSLEHKTEIALYCAVREEVKILKDNAQPTAQPRYGFPVERLERKAGHLPLPAGRGQCTIEGFEQARLATAGFADQVHKLPFGNVQIDFRKDPLASLFNVNPFQMDDGTVIHILICGWQPPKDREAQGGFNSNPWSLASCRFMTKITAVLAIMIYLCGILQWPGPK